MRSILSFLAPAPAAEPLRDDGLMARLYSRYRWQVMVAITLGYGVSYTGRLAIGVVKKPLIDAGIYNAEQLGLIGSAFFYAYAFGKLFSGVLADHVSLKRFLALGFLASAVFNLVMGSTTNVAAATVVWGLNGVFQSFGAPACVVALSAWFSNRERGRMYGVWSMAHSIGEGSTYAVIGAVVAWFGWRAGFFAPTLILLAATVLVLAWVRERPPAYGLPPVAQWRNDRGTEPDAVVARGDTAEGNIFLGQLAILKRPAIWVLAISSALAYVSRYAVAGWGVLFLQEARGYSLTEAGSLLFVSTLAGMGGSVAYGFISDTLFGARRPPANLLFGALEVGGLMLVFYGPQNTLTLSLGMILFGMGMTGLVTSLGGLFATDICDKRVAGAVMGMIGVFSYLGAAIQEQVSGILIQRGTTMVDGVRHYDFGPATAFWIGASVLSLILASTLWRVRVED